MVHLECHEDQTGRSGELSALKDRLVRQIRADGPLPVSSYMQTCLHDPAHGYYATRPGLGTDFTTAPEISQMFGELLGAWAAHERASLGGAERPSLVELGPGRGTLMADALRVLGRLPHQNAIDLHLIEASPALRQLQSERLSAWEPAHQASLGTVPVGRTVILANEFLDCLPVRQFVQAGGIWRERLVGASPQGDLMFGLDGSSTDPAALGASVSTQADQAFEVQPGLDGLVALLKTRAAEGDRFRALFIDYGPDTHAPVDTLRAYRAGEQVDPLASPGEADLTADVDFARLKRLAEASGLSVAGPVTQGAFLGALGLQARLDVLIKSAPEQADDQFARAARLVDPTEMGTRFKVICLSSPGLADPAGF